MATLAREVKLNSYHTHGEGLPRDLDAPSRPHHSTNTDTAAARAGGAVAADVNPEAMSPLILTLTLTLTLTLPPGSESKDMSLPQLISEVEKLKQLDEKANRPNDAAAIVHAVDQPPPTLSQVLSNEQEQAALTRRRLRRQVEIQLYLPEPPAPSLFPNLDRQVDELTEAMKPVYEREVTATRQGSSPEATYSYPPNA